MRYKPLMIGALLSLVLIAVTVFVAVSGKDNSSRDDISALAVTANEAENLMRSGDTQAAEEKIAALRQDAQAATALKTTKSSIGLWIVCGLGVIIVNVSIIYTWVSIIKPFHKLEAYTEKLAAGEFDVSLDYERSNYFGKFTWAFDSMRREIIKARSCEREAMENNKTVIASLSHDLKTPVASISAYSEALVNGLYSSTEEMYSYLDVISKKCEEIAKITGDMITHSIGELGALKMNPTSFDLAQLIEKTVRESSVNGDIKFEKPMFPVAVCADKNRFSQLIGNLIGNAQKYAGGKMDISITKQNDLFSVHFRDYGQGIPSGDLPFVFDKFYRGSNTSDKSGSGLGLYIVKYIAQQSGGDAFIENKEPGLEVTVTIPEEKKN